MTDKVYIVMAIAFVIAVLLLSRTTDQSRFSQFSLNLQALVTAAAIVVAGSWYFIERRGMPHADVNQTVHAVPVARELVAVEVHVSVKNIGRLHIELSRVSVRLQNVTEGLYAYNELASLTGEDYWTATRPMMTPDVRQFHSGELRWPVINQFSGNVTHVIEAEETDLMVFTFLVRCPSLNFVRIATDIRVPGDEDDLAWKARSFLDVRESCQESRGII